MRGWEVLPQHRGKYHMPRRQILDPWPDRVLVMRRRQLLVLRRHRVLSMRVGVLQRRCGFGLLGVHRRGQLGLDLGWHDRYGLRLHVQRGLQRLWEDVRGVRGR